MFSMGVTCSGAMRKLAQMTITAIAVIMLTSCGGGGGGGGGSGNSNGGSNSTLVVSFAYPSDSIDVYSPANIPPRYGNFGGHTPKCTLKSGALPPGMNFQGCNIVGTPTATGIFSFIVTVGADGISNTLDISSAVNVTGPLDYPSKGVAINQSTTISPTYTTGFQGLAVNCTLMSGTIPPGMNFQGCDLIGTPTTAGLYSFVVTVSAPGIASTFFVADSIEIVSPSLAYDFTWDGSPAQMQIGDQVSEKPTIQNWAVASDVSTTWSYQVQSGALPPGLTLNSTTGEISGSPAVEGDYQATVKATYATPFGSGDLATDIQAKVTLHSFGWGNIDLTPGNQDCSGSLRNQYCLTAYISQSFGAEPVTGYNQGTVSGFSVTSTPLPQGLILDQNTGIISGVPTTATPGASYPIAATVSFNGGAGHSVTADFRVEVVGPANVEFTHLNAPIYGTVGAPVHVGPTVVQVSPVPLNNPTYSYQLESGCQFPPGVSFNTITNVVEGTPTAVGDFDCWIDATTTNNGMSWITSSQLFFRITQ